MQQITTVHNPLLAMAEIQGAVMGTYVNKLERNMHNMSKKYKTSKEKYKQYLYKKIKLKKKVSQRKRKLDIWKPKCKKLKQNFKM